MARKESRKTTTGGGSKRGRASKAASESQSQPTMESEGGGTATATEPITHAQIAERARQIWEQHGCPQGEDERNWREAERQLKAEMGINE